MKKPSIKEQHKREEEILAACREVRRQCSKLSDDERQRSLEEGLAIIHGRDAKTHARSH
jgi:predicted translin family RNA/ssDNA-binding protein